MFGFSFMLPIMPFAWCEVEYLHAMADWACEALFAESSSFILAKKLPVSLLMQKEGVERNDVANWRMDAYRIPVKMSK